MLEGENGKTLEWRKKQDAKPRVVVRENVQRLVRSSAYKTSLNVMRLGAQLDSENGKLR
jgi:hypothetical protein